MAYRPQVKTSNGMVDLPLDAETIKGKTLLEQTYPVGAIYVSVNNTSPASLFGGTWEQLKDRFLLGAGDTYSNGATGGEATHVLTTDEMPSHRHDFYITNEGQYTISGGKGVNGLSSWSGIYDIFPYNIDNKLTSIQNTGGGQAHNNMPPYLVVYIWKRTA